MIQTKQLVSFENDECAFSFDYDDVTMHPTVFRCINNGNFSARAVFMRADGTVVHDEIYLAHSGETLLNIPANVSNSITLVDRSVSGSGKLAGYKSQYWYPA